MPKWRDSSQKKEQERVMAREQFRTDINNMPDPEFKTTIIRILAGLEKSIEDIRESLTAKIEELKTSHAKINN